MNRKQLTLLIVLGIVIGGLGYYAYKKQQSSYEGGSASSEGQKLLKDVSTTAINDVAHITIRQATNSVNLVRSNETWTVQERGGYPANFGTISETLKKLWEMKITRPVEVGPSRLPQLKLTKGDGTLVEMKDEKGKTISSLLLGLQPTKDTPNDSPFGGGGSFPSGRYVMRGDDVKSVALIADPLSNIEPKPEDWLNKDWFKVEKPKAISVVSTNATNSWKLVRETESGEWKLADAKPGETVDSGKTSGLNYVLSSPSFNDVLVDPKPEKIGLDKATTATIETFDGFKYTFKLGKAEGDNYALQMTVAGDFLKERTPGKDEKKEDKEKLDKEFADKRKQHQEKLKNEKQFEKWTYLVSNWTVDNLLKPRTDFLAEKKEEPKPATNAAPSSATPAPPNAPAANATTNAKPSGTPTVVSEPIEVKPANPKPADTK